MKYEVHIKEGQMMMVLDKNMLERLYETAAKAYEDDAEGWLGEQHRTEGRAQLDLMYELGLVDQSGQPTWR